MLEEKRMASNILVDSFGRHHTYLRISVTDRCNLRCFYCMGPKGVPRLNPSEILKYEDILRVVQVAVNLGINRIRLTGGEPLVRNDLSKLIRCIRQIYGSIDLSLTTNGILLREHAAELYQAGLNRINISLDTLDSKTYAQITGGGNLNQVLNGIYAALDIGLNPVKINVVLLRGMNDHELINFLRLVYSLPIHVRFIEYMPLGYNQSNQSQYFMPVDYIREAAAGLNADLQPVTLSTENGVAETYNVSGGKGTISLIHPISHKFCATCNRLRLTADGFLKPCLYWQDELPVKPALGEPAKLRQLFYRAMEIKRAEHQMSFTEERSCMQRSMSRIGG